MNSFVLEQIMQIRKIIDQLSSTRRFEGGGGLWEDMVILIHNSKYIYEIPEIYNVKRIQSYVKGKKNFSENI